MLFPWSEQVEISCRRGTCVLGLRSSDLYFGVLRCFPFELLKYFHTFFNDSIVYKTLQHFLSLHSPPGALSKLSFKVPSIKLLPIPVKVLQRHIFASNLLFKYPVKLYAIPVCVITYAFDKRQEQTKVLSYGLL